MHVNVFLFLFMVLSAINFSLEFFCEQNVISEETSADKTKKKYTLTHKKYFNEEVTEVIMEEDDIQGACDKFSRTLNELDWPAIIDHLFSHTSWKTTTSLSV